MYITLFMLNLNFKKHLFSNYIQFFH